MAYEWKYANINDFGAAFGLKRSSIYKMLHDGRLRAIKVGRRTLIDVVAAEAWLAAQPAAEIKSDGKGRR